MGFTARYQGAMTHPQMGEVDGKLLVKSCLKMVFNTPGKIIGTLWLWLTVRHGKIHHAI